MKAKPGEIKVATAGVTSGGHNAMELISKATGVKYRHVTYDGGNPAVVATVAGETDVTTQLAVEQADMIRGKRIRPLAAVSDKPLELEGFGTIEPITKYVPGIKVPTNYFGIFIPKGVPPEVVVTLQKIWAENIRQQRGAEEVRQQPRRAVRAGGGRRGAARRGMPAIAGQRVADVRHRQGQGLARHGRHPAPLRRRQRGIVGLRRTHRKPWRADGQRPRNPAVGALRPDLGRRVGRHRRGHRHRLVAHGPAERRKACRGSRRQGCCPASWAC